MRESGRTIEIQGYNWFYRWLLYVLRNLVPSVFPGGFLVKFGFAPLICWLRYVARPLFWDEPTTLGNPENPIRRRILFHRRIRYAFSRTQSNPSVCNKPYHKIFRSLCEERENIFEVFSVQHWFAVWYIFLLYLLNIIIYVSNCHILFRYCGNGYHFNCIWYILKLRQKNLLHQNLIRQHYLV